MARHVLESMNNRPDPLFSIDWYAQMPTLPFLGQGSVGLGFEYVEETSVPLWSFDQVSTFRAGKNYSTPGHAALSNISMKFYEDNRGTTTSYLTAWQSLIRDPDTGLYTVPSKHKKDIKIVLLDVTNSSVMVVNYVRCWPVSIDQISLNSDQASRVIMGAEFSVDEVKVNIGTYSWDEIPSEMFNADFNPKSIMQSARGLSSSIANNVSMRFNSLQSSLRSLA